MGCFILMGCVDVLMGCVDVPGSTSSAPTDRTAAGASVIVATAASPASARASAEPAIVPPKQWPKKVLTWDYETSNVGKTRVVIVSPETTEPLPVLIALHGLGEARKGPARGARGWIDDYGLLKALERLSKPPLTAEDMQRLGTDEHLAAVNAQLAEQPFRGLIVVCPYTPDILGAERSLDAARPLGKFIVDEVLPRVYEETPALRASGATGIDGVSLGGRAALLVGLAYPQRFGAVGLLQAAIYPPDLKMLTQRVSAARARNPSLSLRLLTSSQDFYRATITRWSRSLAREDIDHTLQVIDRGPHSYAFNRGLGVYAMLMFHDRVLREAGNR